MGRGILTVDSVTGTIIRTFDGLDRLATEVSPQGGEAYSYNAAGRRTSLTVAGQPTINYTYDNTNRLTQVTQGTSNVLLGYDADNRRTTLALPNGVTASYTYDAASQLTGITYRLGSALLGNLTYTYDNAGKRTNVGGSFARTALPTALANIAYNADNQLTQFGTSSLTYDANGNLISDGVNTYTWDARNHLISITSGSTTIASFQYDPLGRRVSKTVSGATTGFLYDGVNVVQELSAGAPTANLLTGLAVDEIFIRTDSAGPRNFLADAVGSTLALTDPAGTIQTQYTYQPFGAQTFTGAASNSSFQYAGRENDGTGLYYYRARYFSPTFQRFLSEDPIDFAGGINLYAYVGNNPLDFGDPFGLGGTGTTIGPAPDPKPAQPNPTQKPQNQPPRPDPIEILSNGLTGLTHPLENMVVSVGLIGTGGLLIVGSTALIPEVCGVGGPLGCAVYVLHVPVIWYGGYQLIKSGIQYTQEVTIPSFKNYGR